MSRSRNGSLLMFTTRVTFFQTQRILHSIAPDDLVDIWADIGKPRDWNACSGERNEVVVTRGRVQWRSGGSEDGRRGNAISAEEVDDTGMGMGMESESRESRVVPGWKTGGGGGGVGGGGGRWRWS
ncbi:hypothetical protein B7494_g2129 [Chlorociboria aeruginascens]|nr:hypothetical protein B7494_g2129 [Chlorociboria aeruginascens]